MVRRLQWCFVHLLLIGEVMVWQGLEEGVGGFDRGAVGLGLGHEGRIAFKLVHIPYEEGLQTGFGQLLPGDGGGEVESAQGVGGGHRAEAAREAWKGRVSPVTLIKGDFERGSVLRSKVGNGLPQAGDAECTKCPA